MDDTASVVQQLLNQKLITKGHALGEPLWITSDICRMVTANTMHPVSPRDKDW